MPKYEEDIYISVDIEADGDFPGLSSMLSFGAAAFDSNRNLLGTISRNLELLPEGVPSPSTMEFWAKNPEAWNACRSDLVEPKIAIQDFNDFLAQFDGRVVFVGYPAPYDFKWIDYYFIRYLGRNPFGHSMVIDMKTYAWSLLGGQFSKVSKRKFPKTWFEPLPHTHIAIDDAIEQGYMFLNMLSYKKSIG